MEKALVFSLALVVGLGIVGFGQALGVTWTTDVVLDLTGGPWPTDVDVLSELGVEYIVGDWTLSSASDVENGVWTSQDFAFAGALGAFTISGDAEFDPAIPEFVSLELDVVLAIAGVTFGVESTLVPGGVEVVLTGSGEAGDVSIDAAVTLGDQADCAFDFELAEITVGFPFCCTDISAEIELDCRGFGYAEFCVEGIAIENLPWLTLGACVDFQVERKHFVLTPEIDLGLIGCDFDLYYRLDDHGGDMDVLAIDGIFFDGIEVACEIGGVQFTGITYFGPGVYTPGIGWHLPSILHEYEDKYYDFFEAYRIATTDDGCCGPFRFDVTFLFPGSTMTHPIFGPIPIFTHTLFGMGWVSVNLEVEIAKGFTFGIGIETDLLLWNMADDVTFTFLVEW
jgi:hypothetical protein